MKKQSLVFFCVVLFVLCLSPYARERLSAGGDVPVFIDPRYEPTYPPRFFELGGEAMKYNPKLHLKMGVVIRNQAGVSIPEIIATLFTAAPLDRYRQFFVFADANEVERQVRLNNEFITTYDANARRIPRGFDWSAIRIRAGLVVLDTNDYEFRKTGTLGYSYEKTAITQKMTILHELGHVLGDLGDEYSIGEQVSDPQLESVRKAMGKEYQNSQRSWNRIRANLEYRTRKPLKWFPLIEKGFLPEAFVPRMEMKEERDVGVFWIPDYQCIMNHPEKSGGRFCPVCQLQLIDRISQFTGAKVPWEENFE